MSLSAKVYAFVQRVGEEFHAIRALLGSPDQLTTHNRDNVVHAINELRDLIANIPGAIVIDDANAAATSTTLSAAAIVNRLDQLKSEILGNADGAFDTLKELQDALTRDHSGILSIAQALESCVRIDAEQSLSTDAQDQVCRNIGAVSQSAIGDTDVDLVAVFLQALQGSGTSVETRVENKIESTPADAAATLVES